MLALFLRPLLTAGIALRALRRNKLRSSLTALGIIIGVASVVAMVAVGKGAQASIEGRVAALGQNLLTIFAGNRRSGGVNVGLGSASVLTLEDAKAIQREVAGIKAMSPEMSSTTQVVANGKNWSTTVVGQSEQYLEIRDWALESGSMFGEREIRSAAKVAVIGSKTSLQLFGPVDPVGRTIRIKNIPFVIIGKLESKGASMGGDQDDRVIIPYTTSMKRLTGAKYLRSISIQVESDDQMAIVEQQIRALLRQRHRLPEGRDDDFNVLNQKEIADTVGSITAVITVMLGSIASMSLLVGGIGIMNIMLVSVTERTREIGIRVAVGAQGGDIMLQFLVEAIALSLLGGAIGVGLGIGGAQLINQFGTFKAIVSPASVVLAFSVSAAIGIFFGFYPARKAAALDPIDALRYE